MKSAPAVARSRFAFENPSMVTRPRPGVRRHTAAGESARRIRHGKAQYLAHSIQICMDLHTLPLARLTPRALGAYLRLSDHGPRASRASIDNTLGVGPSSVTRYLQELSAWGLVLRLAHGEYAVPQSSVRRLLLVEPDPYHREVLLLDDAYRDEPGRAFACLPVRNALRMEIPHAILVLPPITISPDDPPQVARMRLTIPPSRQEVAVPSDSPSPAAFARFPCVAPVEALALLASTGDADLLAAAKDAAPLVGTTVHALAAAVRGLKVAPLGAEHDLPHMIRHPDWLMDRVRAAGIAALRRSTRNHLERRGTP